jgi:ferric-dicitrate binding protein FerR (iron transport regulator)
MHEELNTYQVLITRLLAGEASETDRMQLDQWLNDAPENRLLFDQFKAAWEFKPADTDYINISREDAWQKINAGINHHELSEAEPMLGSSVGIRKINIFRISGIAAMILALIGIYFLLLNPGQSEMTAYQTEGQPGEPLALSDRSFIHLNSNSSITYPLEFKGKKRPVKMDGQGFFEVAHIPGKPFIIETGGAYVTVLGTSFNITHEEKKGMLEVAVISGNVMLQPADDVSKELILSQGEKGIFNKGSNTLTKEIISNHNFLAWRTGRLEFDQTSLNEVFETIGATYHLEVVAEQDFSDLKLTARFIDEDPADIFKTIGMLFGLEVDHKPGIYTIRQR